MSDLQNFSSFFYGLGPLPDKSQFLQLKSPDDDAATDDGLHRLDRDPSQRSELQIESNSIENRDSAEPYPTSDTANPTNADDEILVLPPLAPLVGPILQLNPLQVEVSPEVIGRGGGCDAEADAALLESMRRDSTNAEPALVRRLPHLEGQSQRYEVIHGQRRLRACLELGLPLRAQVENLSPTEVLRYVVSSHAGWHEHALIDKGHWAKARLESGRFPTANALCKFTGWDPGSLSRYICLAEFPRLLTDLFARSKGLQHRHVGPLKKLLQADTQWLLARAMAVAEDNENKNFKMTAKELFQALLPKRRVEEKVKSPRKTPCADCVCAPGAAATAAEPTTADWRSTSRTKSLVIDDDGLELADVSTDSEGFTCTRYCFRNLTQADREWLAQEELEMLQRAPFYKTMQSNSSEKGGTP